MRGRCDRCFLQQYRIAGYYATTYPSVNRSDISNLLPCNRFHSIEQRLARWLLEACERTETQQKIYLTHEFMSNMLGVRRTGVTLAASKLQNKNIIRYNRGHVEIIDRQKLEETGCECFCTVKAEYDRPTGNNEQ